MMRGLSPDRVHAVHVRDRRSRVQLIGDPNRRIVVSRISLTRDCSIPETAKLYEFETAEGKPTCWRPSTMSVDSFVDTLIASPRTLFNRRAEVKLYFPVYASYFVTKTFYAGSNAGFTMQRLMRHFDTLAEVAIAHYLKTGKGMTDIRLKDVHQHLKAYAVCSLRVKDNRIYAFTHDARQGVVGC